MKINTDKFREDLLEERNGAFFNGRVVVPWRKRLISKVHRQINWLK